MPSLMAVGKLLGTKALTALGDYRFLAHLISPAVWGVEGFAKKGVPKVGHLYV